MHYGSTEAMCVPQASRLRPGAYEARRVGSYALCLAAGYAALLCPTMGWSAERLAPPMDEAQHLFFAQPGLHAAQEGVILRIVALKYAACRLFYLQMQHDRTGVATETGVYLAHLHDLAPYLPAHATLVRFFETARAQPETLAVSAVLQAVFTLPY